MKTVGRGGGNGSLMSDVLSLFSFGCGFILCAGAMTSILLMLAAIFGISKSCSSSDNLHAFTSYFTVVNLVFGAV